MYMNMYMKLFLRKLAAKRKTSPEKNSYSRCPGHKYGLAFPGEIL